MFWNRLVFVIFVYGLAFSNAITEDKTDYRFTNHHKDISKQLKELLDTFQSSVDDIGLLSPKEKEYVSLAFRATPIQDSSLGDLLRNELEVEIDDLIIDSLEEENIEFIKRKLQKRIFEYKENVMDSEMGGLSEQDYNYLPQTDGRLFTRRDRANNGRDEGVTEDSEQNPRFKEHFQESEQMTEHYEQIPRYYEQMTRYKEQNTTYEPNKRYGEQNDIYEHKSGQIGGYEGCKRDYDAVAEPLTIIIQKIVMLILGIPGGDQIPRRPAEDFGGPSKM